MTRKRIRLKPLPFIIIVLLLIPIFTISLLFKMTLSEEPAVEDYITEETTSPTVPVINTDPKPINPYTDSSVTIGKKYYEYKGDEQNQISAILKHDDTYLQNSGIDYVSENVFDVIAIMNGTVSNVKEDETVGKTIEIKHNDGIVSIYQGLSEVSVKKGDVINQGQILGKSGTNELDKDLGNHLHLEIYNNGQAMNPEDYLKTSNKKEN